MHYLTTFVIFYFYVHTSATQNLYKFKKYAILRKVTWIKIGEQNLEKILSIFVRYITQFFGRWNFIQNFVHQIELFTLHCILYCLRIVIGTEGHVGQGILIPTDCEFEDTLGIQWFLI